MNGTPAESRRPRRLQPWGQHPIVPPRFRGYGYVMRTESHEPNSKMTTLTQASRSCPARHDASGDQRGVQHSVWLRKGRLEHRRCDSEKDPMTSLRRVGLWPPNKQKG